MEAIIGDTFAKNTETGTSRSCSFGSFDEYIHSSCQLYTERRKQVIRGHIEGGGKILTYEDTTLKPQISYNQFESANRYIDMFYDDVTVEMIEYGTSSTSTTHCLYRHTDKNVCVAITKQRSKVIRFNDQDECIDATDEKPIQDENGLYYIDIITIYPVTKKQMKTQLSFQFSIT